VHSGTELAVQRGQPVRLILIDNWTQCDQMTEEDSSDSYF